MERRRFIEICLAGTSGCATLPGNAKAPSLPMKATTPLVPREYSRVRLIDREGKPIFTRSLKLNHNYVFNYPYESSPCFLLNLDKPLTGKTRLSTAEGNAYDWPGGVGANESIVAYSAICAHKLAYPTRQVSFIGFRGSPSATNARGKVITCCADKSVYDPFNGAKVVSGPAPQPLAAIILEHDAKTDGLYAVGTLGGEKFNEFFQKYDFKLSMEMGDRARQFIATTTTLYDLANYSAQTAQC